LTKTNVTAAGCDLPVSDVTIGINGDVLAETVIGG